jgi:hypothetical protein
LLSCIKSMNQLAIEKRAQIIAALVEGTSVNATCRMTGVAKHTVLKLLKDPGCAAASYHDSHVRNLRVRRLQCDEIWAFVGAKMRNTSAPHSWSVRIFRCEWECAALLGWNGFSKKLEPRTRGCPVLHALQLLPRTQNATRHTCDGSWTNGLCLGNRGIAGSSVRLNSQGTQPACLFCLLLRANLHHYPPVCVAGTFVRGPQSARAAVSVKARYRRTCRSRQLAPRHF